MSPAAQPLYDMRLTESQLKDLFQADPTLLCDVSSQSLLEIPDDIRALEHFTFSCKALEATVTVHRRFIDHLLGSDKPHGRRQHDIDRRCALAPSAIKIAELARTIIIKDATTDKQKGVVYWEFMGCDEVRLPGEIVVAKLSHSQSTGLILWSCINIKMRRQQ